MQDKAPMMSISDIVQNVFRLCKEGRTGTLYLITDTNDGAIFVLNGGSVVDVAYKNVHGTSALPLIRRINSAKFFFKSGRTAEVENASKVDIKLSFGHALFRMFNLGQEVDPSSESVANQRGKKILIVEDSRISRTILTRTLKDNGFLVVEAADGRSALALLAQETPDLVILDLILPDIDGYEIFSRMKKNKDTADIPVIILTSRGSLVDKLKGKMSGSDEYLTKPFKNEVLLKKLEKYL